MVSGSVRIRKLFKDWMILGICESLLYSAFLMPSALLNPARIML